MKRLRRWAVDYLVAFLVVLTGTYIFYLVMPTSFWVTYHDVVIEDADASDGKIEMRSIRTITRPIDLGGLDILFCDLNGDGEYGHASSAPWNSGVAVPNDGPRPTGPWSYSAALPAPGTSCYTRSIVSLRLPFLITRKLEPIESPPFIIGPDEIAGDV